jgi:hypothetical protein
MSGLFFTCLPANFLHISSHPPIHLSILQYVPLIDEKKVSATGKSLASKQTL